jgi:hypothetical protein
VQLPDVFEALPTEEAQQELQRELAAMRSLSLKLLRRQATGYLTGRIHLRLSGDSAK